MPGRDGAKCEVLAQPQLQGSPSPHEEKVTLILFDSWNIQTNSFILNVLPFLFCPCKNVQLRMGKKKNPRIFQLTEGLHFLKTLKLPKMFLKHGNWSACRGMLFLSQAIFQCSSYPATASFCFLFPLTMFTYPQNVNLSKFDISSKDFF